MTEQEWTTAVNLLIVVAIYILPLSCAIARDHDHYLEIVALNVLSGWTVLGWIVSLRWALTPPRVRPAVSRAMRITTPGNIR